MAPTSFRFDPDLLALLDAWAEALSVGRRKPASRADVVHLAVKRLKPGPNDPPEVHRAYTAAFGKPLIGSER